MRLFPIFLALLLLYCGGDDDSCKTGDEGCPCFENETCNRGLSCKSKTCVDLGSTDNEEEDLEDEGDKTDSSEGEEDAGESGSSGEESPCVPDCSEIECGPDPVCGESCGRCSAGFDCVAGACISATPLKENGELCSDDSECASGICEENLVGEEHCYGDVGPNAICGDVFDCLGGLCVPKEFNGGTTVCVPSVVVCQSLDMPDSCLDLSIVSCQFALYCGLEFARDFDDCVGWSCNYWYENPPDLGCAGMVDFYLSGNAECE